MKEIEQFKSKSEWKIGEVIDGCVVPKGWGEEFIIENNEMYCGKLLKFNAGCKFSMHYHMIKDETWYVSFGEFIYRWIDTQTAEIHSKVLNAGDIVRQMPGLPHQLEAVTAGVVFEVSTYHSDSDSYRVMKGDEQKRKVQSVAGRKHKMNIIVKDPKVSDVFKKYIEDDTKEGIVKTKKRKKK